MNARPWQWGYYLYEIGEPDNPIYIGKGSGDRLSVQKRRFQVAGREIARFKDEEAAYAA